MRSRLSNLLAPATALVLLAACGSADEPSDDPGEVEVPSGDDIAGDDQPADAPDTAAGSDPLLGPEIEVALDDLAGRVGADREQILITVTDLVSWPDGSLGCPEPDTMYTQAIEEGYRIVLEVDGQEYAYHGAEGEPPAYCEDPQPPVD